MAEAAPYELSSYASHASSHAIAKQYAWSAVVQQLCLKGSLDVCNNTFVKDIYCVCTWQRTECQLQLTWDGSCPQGSKHDPMLPS